MQRWIRWAWWDQMSLSIIYCHSEPIPIHLLIDTPCNSFFYGDPNNHFMRFYWKSFEYIFFIGISFIIHFSYELFDSILIFILAIHPIFSFVEQTAVTQELFANQKMSSSAGTADVSPKVFYVIQLTIAAIIATKPTVNISQTMDRQNRWPHHWWHPKRRY